RRRLSRHARDLRSLRRRHATALRLRGGGDRRGRLDLGHADRRDRAGAGADDRRAVQPAGFPDGGARGVLRRAVRPAVYPRPRFRAVAPAAAGATGMSAVAYRVERWTPLTRLATVA